MAFEAKLQALLLSYKMGLADMILILDPGFAAGKVGGVSMEKRSRRPREVKIYRNPLTGETVESKGGNNKLLGNGKQDLGVKRWGTGCSVELPNTDDGLRQGVLAECAQDVE